MVKGESITIAQYDYLDVFILANRLTLPQLRTEIRHTDIRIKSCEAGIDIAEAGFDDPEYWREITGYWRAYKELAIEAIDVIQTSKPKAPTPTRYHFNVADIKSQNDIVSVIEQYTRLRKSGRNFTGCCPIHQEKHPSLTVYPDQQTWHCYGCNAGGDVFNFIMAANSCDFKQAAALLGSR